MRLIVVIGMPGSGKTTYLERLKSDGKIEAFYDDFQAGAPQKDKNPRLSRYYSDLVKNLRLGKTVAVTDIRYCSRKELNLLIAAVIDAVPEVELDLRYFKNDPQRCLKNVKNRASQSAELQQKLINEFSRSYQVPIITTSILEVYS